MSRVYSGEIIGQDFFPQINLRRAQAHHAELRSERQLARKQGDDRRVALLTRMIEQSGTALSQSASVMGVRL